VNVCSFLLPLPGTRPAPLAPLRRGKGEVLDSLLAICKRIRCDTNTERAESGRDVHEILAQVKEELLLELNSRIAASEAPMKLFQEQRDLVAILGRNLKHPTVPREDSLELLQVLREPRARPLRRELRDCWMPTLIMTTRH
jgi:hypothetical protein